ncbi:hypothetical protein ACHAXA_006925 [Cyclostephanos tholiformis]|uniref:Uncharacterized protein n=1 Tax=Cyclostephanos tholiformis TaxID=382380 RepID=A0ABD3RRS3_9STRA
MASHHGKRVDYSSPTRRLIPFLALSALPSFASFHPPCRDVTSSVSRPHHRGPAVHAASDEDHNYHHRDRERFIVASALVIIPWFLGLDRQVPNMAMPPAAHALQERNEVLCNTGFFTNVGAWYCTDIGNIGDEGKSKALSDDARARVDSLMSKFNFDDGDIGVDAGGGSDQSDVDTGKRGGGDSAKVAARD